MVAAPFLKATFRDQENKSSETKFRQNIIPLEFFVLKLLREFSLIDSLFLVSILLHKKLIKLKKLHIISKYKSIKTNHLLLNYSRLVAIAGIMEESKWNFSCRPLN